MAQTLAELSRGRDNNLNLLRALAATTVIITHAFGLTGNSPLEPGNRLFGFSLGSIAVDLFFIVSGFLITKSWDRRGQLTDFFYARFMRIYPALWLCVAFCLLVVGPLFTTLSLTQFFTHFDTLKFLLENTTLLLNGVATHLPSTFDGQGMGGTNVSLWTLPFELRMYILLALLGFTGLLNRRWLVAAMVVACGSYYLWYLAVDGSGDRLAVYCRFIWFFFSGALLYLYRQQLRMSHSIAAGLTAAVVAVILLSEQMALRQVALSLVLPWLSLYLAMVPAGAIRHYNRLGDYSYGLYIYAFPVQQSVLALAGGMMAPWLNFGWSLLITLVLAVLSWHLLEERALKMPMPQWLRRCDEGVKVWWQRALARSGD